MKGAPVDVYITPLVMTKPGKVSDGLRLSPADGLPVVFSGLSYGSYAVQARERVAPDAGRGRLAGVMIVLDAAHPDSEIELELTDRRGVLRVVDESGNAVGGAVVRSGGEGVKETTSAVFALDNVAPGSFVAISAPGFTPISRIVPSESPFDVVLRRGIQVRIRYVAGNPRFIRGLLTWGGTDSLVPLTRFAVTPAPDGTGDFIVQNFPADPDVLYIADPFDPPDRYVAVKPDLNGVIQVK